jgi:dTDP-4-dehydrorhamnose reductase
MNILILGGSGMLGHTLVQYLSQSNEYNIFVTFREHQSLFQKLQNVTSIYNIDARDDLSLNKAFEIASPNIVINCIGIIKQLEISKDPLEVIPINSLLPHKLAKLSRNYFSRMIHISTDCVFNGEKGNYTEDDQPDAIDLYGRSKALGEITSDKHAITIRTSIIGHEIKSNYSLVDWFLSQTNSVQGYNNAIFSGLPTIEIAEVIHNIIIKNSTIFGLYHLASEPISKFQLLKLIAETYGKKIDIVSNTNIVLNRSLDGTRFNTLTGYNPDSWIELVKKMYLNYEFKKGFNHV